MNLTVAIALAAFGHDSNHPKRKALSLCVTLVVASLGFGSIAAAQLSSLSIVRNWPYPYDLLFVLTLCVQIVATTCLISSRGILNSSSTITRLLHILPLTMRKRWVLVHLPQIFLLCLVTLAVAPGLQTCISMLNLSPLWSLLILSAGSLSALSLCYGPWQDQRQGFIVGLLWVASEIWLMRRILDVTEIPQSKIFYYCSFVMIMITLVCSLQYTQIKHAAKRPHYVTVHLPKSMWFTAKIVRSYTGRVSFWCACICISLITAGALYLREYSTTLLCTACGLVLASFCSDIRSLTRTDKPPEILALKGTWHFIKHQGYSYGIALLTAMPIVAYLLYTHAKASALAIGIVQLLVGAAAGCFAATLVGAKARDISSQCAAVFISCALFYVCNKLASPLSNESVAAGLFLFGELFALLLATFCIEYKRNTYLWSKKHA